MRERTMNWHLFAFFAMMTVFAVAALMIPGTRAEAKSRSSKKTIYVVAGYTDPDNNLPVKFSYNEDGTIRMVDMDTGTRTYFYDNRDKVVKIVTADPIYHEDYTTKYSYDKNGNIKKIVEKDNESGATICSISYKYNKHGIVSKATEKYAGKQIKYKFKCDSKGRIKKVTSKVHFDGDEKSDNYDDKFTLTYDKKGRLSKEVYSWATEINKYTVKNGKIVKRTETIKWGGNQNIKRVFKYTYKKLSVPKDKLNYVKEQQAGILMTQWTLGE